MHLRFRFHAFRHEALRLGNYHSITLGNEKPTRNVLPKRTPDWNRDAVQRDWSLHSVEQGLILGGCMRRERGRKGFFRQPNQAIIVWCQLGRLGMGRKAIEHVCDLLAFIGGKSAYID